MSYNSNYSGYGNRNVLPIYTHSQTRQPYNYGTNTGTTQGPSMNSYGSSSRSSKYQQSSLQDKSFRSGSKASVNSNYNTNNTYSSYKQPSSTSNQKITPGYSSSSQYQSQRNNFKIRPTSNALNQQEEEYTSHNYNNNTLSRTKIQKNSGNHFIHNQNNSNYSSSRQASSQQDRLYSNNNINNNNYEEAKREGRVKHSGTNSSNQNEGELSYFEKQKLKQQQNGGRDMMPVVNSKTDKGLIGLNNIGNTCFMNSSLQCLFNLPHFNDVFLNNNFKYELNPKSKRIAIEYANLLQQIRSKNSGYSRGESTYGLKGAIEKVSQQFTGYSQQDAQELLRVVLDGLHEDLNRVTTKQAYRELTADYKKHSLQQISDDWFKYYQGRDDSVVQDYFCGQIMNQVTCSKCRNRSLAFDNFLDLSLSFTKGLQKLQECTLERMIENFLKEELLYDEYYCEKCKKAQESSRQFIFWKMPKILVIHLKRFKFGRSAYGSSKLNQSVSFPITNLNLSQFVKESTDPSSQDCVYHLCGVVNHMGSLYGGHYTADCMNPYDHRWYRFNDSHVNEIDIKAQRYDSQGSSNPYILFYVRRDQFK